MVSARAEMKKITDMGIMTRAMGRFCKPPPKTFQFQKPPACFSTIWFRFIVPASRITVMITKPMETS